jgi:hypothetical protein
LYLSLKTTKDVNLNIFQETPLFAVTVNRWDPYRYLTAGKILKTLKSPGFSGINFYFSQLSLQLPEGNTQNSGGFSSVTACGMQNKQHMGRIIFLERTEPAT